MPEQPQSRLPALPAGRAYRFHTMVKPAGALCNLDCPYCFYLHKEDLLHQAKAPRMEDSLLHRKESSLWQCASL